ncbi:NPHP3, partial [Symbiodinium microadriaticum]
ELTGDKKTAMDMYKLAVKIRREVNGAESPELAHVLLLLAQLCFEEDRLDEAETYVGECLSIQQNVHPTAALTSAAAGVSIPDEAVVHILPVLVLHPSAAESASLMGSICKAHVRYNDAKIWFLYAVDVVRAVRGPVNNDIAIILTNLAILNKEVGQMQEAVRLYEEALAIRRQLFKGQSPFIAQSLNNLAVVRKDMGQCAEAKRLFEDAVRMYQACNGGSEESAEVAAAYNNLAGCLHDM